MPAPSASALKLDTQGARVALKCALESCTLLTSDHGRPNASSCYEYGMQTNVVVLSRKRVCVAS